MCKHDLKICEEATPKKFDSSHLFGINVFYLIMFPTAVDINIFISIFSIIVEISLSMVCILILQQIYCDNTTTPFQRTLKILSKWLTQNQEAQLDVTAFKERILSALKNVPGILDELLDYYLDGQLPDRSVKVSFEITELKPFYTTIGPKREKTVSYVIIFGSSDQ